MSLHCSWLLTCLLSLLMATTGHTQPVEAGLLFSKHTLYAERLKRRNGLFRYTILPLLKQPPDTTNEYQFRTALWSISQFMLKNDTTRQLADSLFLHYPALETATRRSLLEVVYALYPVEYSSTIRKYWQAEPDDRSLAIMLLYLKRNQEQAIPLQEVDRLLTKARFDTSVLLQQTRKALFSEAVVGSSLTDLADLFRYHQQLGVKIIYSIQPADRNHPGLAIVRNADGRFVSDSLTGRVKTFVQLARSATGLPFFLTNGNTPQGIYRIKGTDVSINHFIGPTPNLQLRMPHEIPADSFFIHSAGSITDDAIFLKTYQQLLPERWRNGALLESYEAGKCGRAAIIAHGTALDPWYYQQQPFYPCTPSLGCLCAREIWNPNTGKVFQSDQLEMVKAFYTTPGDDGYLFVINLDHLYATVTPELLQVIADR